jgi:molecular chaperone DnaK
VPRIIGIDLGTTNSCVAVAQNGTSRVLASLEGERTTPSVVGFPEKGGFVVGVPARRQSITNATRTVFGIKRLIGRKARAPDVVRFAQNAPFAIVEAERGDAWIRIGHREVSPQEISSYVLERMKRIAEAALGEPVTQAIVTVPAYFDDAQRQATKDAGRIAGLDVRRIVNEPTAAVLAYGVHRRKERQTLAVFDLGGGTFDVSILRAEGGVFEVLATSGDAALGGDDFDRRVMELIGAELREQHGVDVSGDPVALWRLKDEVENAKRILTEESIARIHLPYLVQTAPGQGFHLDRELRRAELEGLTRDLLARLEEPCRRALDAAGVGASGIDEVLLVGGMTRMPAVQAEVERIFGRKPAKGANPDEIVAIGAALHGGILAGEIEDVVLLDVTSHPLGIRVGESAFSVVIPRNTRVPTRVRKLYATSHDDQPFVKVEVFQGDSPDIRQNRKLGRFTLEGLPRGKAGTIRIELGFLVDADGIVAVSAREVSTGRAATLKIEPSGGLSEDEMNRILEARRALAAEPPAPSA